MRMARSTLILLTLMALLVSLAASSCTQYTDWKVAAAYEITATRLDSGTGSTIGNPLILGNIRPPAGASYIWWEGSTFSGSVDNGVAILNLGSAIADTSKGNGTTYDQGEYFSMAVVSSTSVDGLVAAPGDAPRSVASGASTLVIAGDRGYSVGSGPSFVDTGKSYDKASWSSAATWLSGAASGLVAVYSLGSASVLAFYQNGARTDSSAYDDFAGGYIGYEGASSFLAPFFSYALDQGTGKTIKTLSITRIDATARSLAELGRFSIPSPTSYGIVDTLSDGILRSSEGRLVRLALDGTERSSALLSVPETTGEALGGPLAGSGILFTPIRAGDERDSTSGAAVAQGSSYSRYTSDPIRLWSVDLGKPEARFVAALKLSGIVVVIRAQPIGEIVVSHSYTNPF